MSAPSPQNPQVSPYGTWISPITAADVAKGGVHLGWPGFASTPRGEEIWWEEGRPTAGGRAALVAEAADGTHRDVLNPDWNLRSRIHEYGARPWVYVPGAGVVFTFWDDQRLYVHDETGDPRPLTVAPTDNIRHMYGEPVVAPDGLSVIAVRETHRGSDIDRAIVRVPLDGSASENDEAVAVLASGHRFFAFPRPSADGAHLAYTAWDHPQMPWDGALLYVADLDGSVASNHRVLAGSTTESLMQPEWADDTHVYAVSDRSGWWNIYRFGIDDGSVTAVAPRDEEFSTPLWLLGFTTYGVLGDGRIAAIHGVGEQRLSVIDPATGSSHELAAGHSFVEMLQVSGSRILTIAGSLTAEPAVVVIDANSGSLTIVKSAADEEPDPRFFSEAYAFTVAGPDGDVHAWVYPPRNPNFVASEGERPPFIALVHGGPTACSVPVMEAETAYFTSRGIGVVDINYGGSSGYGRAYRERLREKWGIVDVVDSVAIVQGLVDAGKADAARLGIRGGSAGGWTTLASLVTSKVFSAGAASYPVTDLLPFATDTHDFEARYLDGLIGPLPQTRDRYVERSPLTHLGNLSVPVLLLQGDDDKVVPPSQPAAVAAELARKGIPHKYILFAGEQHGFRMAENIITALESELAFFGKVFGFETPGVPPIELD